MKVVCFAAVFLLAFEHKGDKISGHAHSGMICSRRDWCVVLQRSVIEENFKVFCADNGSRRKVCVLCAVCACTILTLLVSLTILVVMLRTTSSTSQHMEALREFYKPGNFIFTPLNHSFILSNEHLCKKDQPYLIVVVPSKETNFRERNAVRETYGSMSLDKVAILNGVKIEHVIRFAFVVGKSDDAFLEVKISQENIQHKDIVQVDMVDSYYNLTLKVLMALKWVDTFCPSANYVLKVDDDVFVHIGLLLNQIHSVKHSDKGKVFGQLLNSTEDFTVNRGTTKTALSYEEYPIKILPPYSQGTSYTLTRDLVPKILQTAPFLPYLHLEDVFINGIIAAQIHGAQMVKLNNTSNWHDTVPVPCQFARSNRLAQTNMSPLLLRRTWNVLKDQSRDC